MHLASVSVGVLAAALLATSAFAADAPASATPSKNPRLDLNLTICKHREVTGSRLQGSKICKTRQEWAEDAEEARRATEARQNQTSLVPPRT